jgi:acetyl-CoA C-acetyltransferase
LSLNCRTGIARATRGALNQTLYNQAQLETPWDITNVNGGAVPLGHPYGMSGIRYLGSTLLELGRRSKRRAVVGVCTAGGTATAAYLERP